MVEEMEDLIEDQVWDGLGFCLKFLQAFRRSDNAEITLAKTQALIRRSLMRTERGWTGSSITRLLVARGGEDDKKDAHFLTGQELTGWGRKLP